MTRVSTSATWISYLLVFGGAFFLYLGARDFVGSRSGQQQAAQAFEAPHSAEFLQPAPAAPAKPPRRGAPVAKLEIPRLDAALYVVEGDGPRELRRGPGHLAGTALPGERGNCVIAGHRDTHFRLLKDIRPGDDILLRTHTGVYFYRVARTAIVSPDDTRALRDTPDAQLNLITCYPFYYVGSAPKRFIVQALLTGSTAPPS
jgi:sortase A